MHNSRSGEGKVIRAHNRCINLPNSLFSCARSTHNRKPFSTMNCCFNILHKILATLNSINEPDNTRNHTRKKIWTSKSKLKWLIWWANNTGEIPADRYCMMTKIFHSISDSHADPYRYSTTKYHNYVICKTLQIFLN